MRSRRAQNQKLGVKDPEIRRSIRLARRNRQIRRMCEAVSLTVKRLRRTNVGGVKLGMLSPGDHADLTKQEMQVLRNAMGAAQTKDNSASPKPGRRSGNGGKRR